MRRWIILAASLVVSVVFLWLALRDVPLTEVLNGIRQADPLWIVLSFVGVFGALAGRAVLWRGLLDNRLSLVHSFHILNITMMLNQLPLRAGEVVRTLLTTRYNIPVVTAATSIVVERLLDVVTVVVILAIGLTRLPNAPPGMAQAAELFGAAAVIAFVVMVSFARYPQIADRVLIWLENRLPMLKRLNLQTRADEVLDGLRPLTHARRAIHAIVWEIISWSFSLITFYCLERALGIQNVDLGLMMLLGVSLASFSIAIPVSVAAIGPFEGAVRVAGNAVNMSAVAATTLGFLFHGITVLGYAFWGVIGLVALGVSFGDVFTQRESTQNLHSTTPE
ncbi:MAG: lysylphosphatidylglycerol synthase transmembrane domain-containing protein [Chloroflexota bacterium]